MQLKLPQITEVKGIRVLTTRQTAEAYETTKDKIIYNFNYNKDRYIDVMRFIDEDANNLLDLKPNIIEKRY